jgi:polyhydroxyalkanoate synthase
VDLSRVDIPLYFISAVEDHIAPWKSCYAGARLFGGPVRFVLGGSGHIAGIINPPAANKYGYWTNEERPAAPEAWLEAASQHAGSWWMDWAGWSGPHGGPRVPARIPGAGALPAIEDAPGSYVAVRGEPLRK